MPLGTLSRTPPPFFKQGYSAFSKLLVFSTLAMFLMVADLRLKLTDPIRSGVATVLYPIQWLVTSSLAQLRWVGGYFGGLDRARASAREATERLVAQGLRAAQVEQLELENNRLRKLLALRETLRVPAHAAQVVYEAGDPYTHRVFLDKGSNHGLKLGSPVMDEGGILGQLTRIYPISSEVTLIIDRDLAIPVLNTRTGARSVIYGNPTTYATPLELRFTATNADVMSGDILSTSGVDGVYPPGIPVAKIDKIERRADSAFAKILCQPISNPLGASHVLVLDPFALQIPLDALDAGASSSTKKGGKK